MEYLDFIRSKQRQIESVGFGPGPLPEFLFPFQEYITRQAIERGRAAVFADCGLGKTPIQLTWATMVAHETGRPVLIVAPLAVSQQTEREGQKFGIPVTICRSGDDITDGVNITNYEMIHHFSPDGLGGIVLDESSILKSYGGKYRQWLTEFASGLRFRLCCTATPAPNDLIEIINHAEFLGVATGKEVIAMFFIQDGNTTHKWRLKGHATRDFWTWLASWSVALRAPSDLGYSDDGFILPALDVVQHTVDGRVTSDVLFPMEAVTLQERLQARRDSLDDRVACCAEMASASTEQWLLWCNLNAESDALKRAVPGAVEVKGSDSMDHKTNSLMAFSAGDIPALVTKPTIAGHGMNWQQCARMAFVGLSDSWEQYYQAVRRCWRFGQKRPVSAHIIVAETEGRVVDNIRRKERDAAELFTQIVGHMNKEYVSADADFRRVVKPTTPGWLNGNGRKKT